MRKADKARKRKTNERKTDTRLKPLKTTKVAFQHALDIAKYRLYDRSGTCNTSVLRKISKKVSKVRAIIQKEGFLWSQLIKIIPFLMNFRMACNNADVREAKPQCGCYRISCAV